MSGTGLTDDFFRANFSSRYGRPKPHDRVDWIRRDRADDCRAVRVLIGIPLGRPSWRPRHSGSRATTARTRQSWQRCTTPWEGDMDGTTLLIIILVIVLVGGGGFYGRGRWW